MTSSPKNDKSKRIRGFTLVEVSIASSVAFVVFGIVGFTVMGLQEAARTSMTQVANRYNSTTAVEKVGRIVMEATKVKVEGGVGVQSVVHIWTDPQIVWTPETTADDTEGLLYFDELNGEIRYQADILKPLEEETLAKNVVQVDFSLVGEALFLKLTLNYDVNEKWNNQADARLKRTVYSSYAVRNNPRVRIGATQ